MTLANSRMGGRVASAALHDEVSRFLFREARLQDELRFNDWLDLFAEEARYRMPVLELVAGGGREGPQGDLVFDFFNDDKKSLQMRVERLETGLAHAELPPSVTEHLISNVEVEDTDDPNEVIAYSKFVVFQLRPGRHESHESQFWGSRIDRLRRTEAGWKIAHRTVKLGQAVLPRTISIFF